jgi:hypothetical protein
MNMTKKLACTFVLTILAAGFAMPAVAAPCCQDCDGFLDPEVPLDEFCVRWCVYCNPWPEWEWLSVEPAACTPTTDEHSVDAELTIPSPETDQPTA